MKSLIGRQVWVALDNFYNSCFLLLLMGCGVVKEHRCEKSTALNSNLGSDSNKQSSNNGAEKRIAFERSSYSHGAQV